MIEHSEEAATTETATPFSIVRQLVAFAPMTCILAACASLLALIGSQPATLLLFGWLGFIRDILPDVNFRLDGIATFTIMLIVALLIAHSLFRWFTGSLPSSSEAAKQQWQIKHTAASMGIFLLVFAVGIAMAGVVHQVGWLATSPTGMFIGKFQSDQDYERSMYVIDEHIDGNQVSWIMQVLHMIPASELENDRQLPWNSKQNSNAYQRLLPTMICPSQGNPIFSPDGYGLAQNAANPAWLTADGVNRFQDSDNLSESLMIGEVNAAFVPWGSHRNQRDVNLGIADDWEGGKRGQIGYGSVHQGGAHFLHPDGHVSFITSTIDPVLLEQLAQRKK